jgi:hypothetical protein
MKASRLKRSVQKEEVTPLIFRSASADDRQYLWEELWTQTARELRSEFGRLGLKTVDDIENYLSKTV